jgi:lipoprotein signal peptidase
VTGKGQSEVHGKHFLIAVLVVVLDRLTKWVVARDIALHDGIQIIPGFFRLTHEENLFLPTPRRRGGHGCW